MKSIISSASFLALMLLVTGCNEEMENPNNEAKFEEKVVIANRGSSSISFIDAATDQVSKTLTIANSEPMYIVYNSSKDKLYVGDRAGNKVHIVNPQSQTIESSVTVGAGVFHMWADGLGKQLWVNNDIDKTISVVDLSTNKVVQTINVGLQPHDVFVSKDGTKAYVSVFSGDASIPDKIYLYDTANFNKIAEVNVGKDPHLFHISQTNTLFVPCQSGQIYSINGSNLSINSNNQFTGAHGIFPTSDQNNLLVTNISGGQIFSVNASSNQQNGSPINSLYSTPHNVVVNEKGDKLYVTHSGGSSTTVSVHNISGTTISSSGNSITAGSNPFGLAYYKRQVK